MAINGIGREKIIRLLSISMKEKKKRKFQKLLITFFDIQRVKFKIRKLA
jgi:hypothetical protein